LSELSKNNSSNISAASNLKNENEELKKQIDCKESKLKDYEEQIKEWKRLVEKMRGNLNIYVRIKPILQSEGISNNKLPFELKDSTIKYTRQFKKFDNSIREKEFV